MAARDLASVLHPPQSMPVVGARLLVPIPTRLFWSPAAGSGLYERRIYDAFGRPRGGSGAGVSPGPGAGARWHRAVRLARGVGGVSPLAWDTGMVSQAVRGSGRRERG